MEPVVAAYWRNFNEYSPFKTLYKVVAGLSGSGGGGVGSRGVRVELC